VTDVPENYWFLEDKMVDRTNNANPADDDACPISPIQRMNENIASVVMRRLVGELDEEQAQQTLEVFTGAKRED